MVDVAGKISELISLAKITHILFKQQRQNTISNNRLFDFEDEMKSVIAIFIFVLPAFPIEINVFLFKLAQIISMSMFAYLVAVFYQ